MDPDNSQLDPYTVAAKFHPSSAQPMALMPGPTEESQQSGDACFQITEPDFMHVKREEQAQSMMVDHATNQPEMPLPVVNDAHGQQESSQLGYAIKNPEFAQLRLPSSQRVVRTSTPFQGRYRASPYGTNLWRSFSVPTTNSMGIGQQNHRAGQIAPASRSRARYRRLLSQKAWQTIAHEFNPPGDFRANVHPDSVVSLPIRDRDTHTSKEVSSVFMSSITRFGNGIYELPLTGSGADSLQSNLQLTSSATPIANPSPSVYLHPPPLDIRRIEPANDAQRREIHDALEITRDSFRYWQGGAEPPKTDSTRSYILQFMQIQNAHNGNWNTETPQMLTRRGVWYGGLERWREARILSPIYEMPAL